MKLRQQEPIASSISTIVWLVEQPDLATVIKVSQAVSGEMALEKLIDMLMRTAIEHAGAEQDLLILPRGKKQRIETQATITSAFVSSSLLLMAKEKLRLQGLRAGAVEFPTKAFHDEALLDNVHEALET